MRASTERAGGPGQGPPQGKGRQVETPTGAPPRGEPIGARDKAAGSAGDPSASRPSSVLHEKRGVYQPVTDINRRFTARGRGPGNDESRSPGRPRGQPNLRARFSSKAFMNSSVDSHGASREMSSARSLVIWPP